MSNYTPVLAYTPKDSLTHGDPLKAIKGAQLDAELQAIASAIASKVDAAGGAQFVISRVKTSTTSKTSTTTLAFDPHLQYAIPAAGTYTFEIWFALAPSSAGGLFAATIYSGTMDTSTSYASRGGVLAGAWVGGVANVVSSQSFSISGTGAGDYCTFKGVLVATSGGTFGLQWAQASSNVNPTTMVSGHLNLVKVS